MTTETGYVYTLSDPRTDEVRYVGATRNPERRLQSHINHPHNDGVSKWIDELQSDDLEPDMEIIDVAETHELSIKERAALDRLSDQFELFNDPSAGGYNDDIGVNQRDENILQVLARGRANPQLIHEETGLDKDAIHSSLTQLGRSGHIRKVTRGLYRITHKGREAADE